MLGISFAQVAVVTIHVTASWCAEGTNHFNTTEPFSTADTFYWKWIYEARRVICSWIMSQIFTLFTFSHCIMIPNIHPFELWSQSGQNIHPFHISRHQLPKSQSFCHSDSFQLKEEQWEIYWKLKISFAVTKLPGQYGQELCTIFPVAWAIFLEWWIVFPRIMDNISIFLGNISKNYGYYFQE